MRANSRPSPVVKGSGAWLAMALAQEPRILFLDEPTSFSRHQTSGRAADPAAQTNFEEGLTIIAVLHDLNQVMDISSDVILMRKGEVLAAGPTHQVLRADLLQQALSATSTSFHIPTEAADLLHGRLGRRWQQAGPPVFGSIMNLSHQAISRPVPALVWPFGVILCCSWQRLN